MDCKTSFYSLLQLTLAAYLLLGGLSGAKGSRPLILEGGKQEAGLTGRNNEQGIENFRSESGRRATRFDDLVDVVYLISLQRRPERREAALQTLQWLGVPSEKVHVINAYDAKQFGRREFVARMENDFQDFAGTWFLGDPTTKGARLPRLRPMQKTEYAVSLSHMSAYADMVRRGIPSAMILEDDFCPSKFLLDEQLPLMLDRISGQWDSIMFGDCFRRGESPVVLGENLDDHFESSLGNFLIHELEAQSGDAEEHLTFNCLHSYAITRSLAMEVLHTSFPVKFPVDVVLPRLLLDRHFYKTFAFHHNLFNQGKSGIDSDVQLKWGSYYELCELNEQQSKYGSCLVKSLGFDLKKQAEADERRREGLGKYCKDLSEKIWKEEAGWWSPPGRKKEGFQGD